MSVIDQNLLSSTAASTSQYSSSYASSTRRNSAEDDRFGDVFDKAASSRERNSNTSKSDDSNEASSSRTESRRESKASDEESSGTERTEKEAQTDKPAEAIDSEADAPENTRRSDDVMKALASAQDLDEAQLEELAEKLGVSAEELSAALKELAAAADADTGTLDSAPEPEDDNIAALLRLLLGQKKADGEQAKAGDTSNEDEEDMEAALEAADGTEAGDNIAELINALSHDANSKQSDAADVDVDAESGPTTFRFERADGKGVPVEMQIGGLDDGTDLETGQTSAKIENVTVLDSRRYLAPADINATNIVNDITGDKSWSTALKSASTSQVPLMTPEKVITEVNTLKIQMHPVDLGTVTATLKLKGDDLVVSMSVQTAEAYNQLMTDKDKIMQSLKAQGFAVDQINIQFTTSPEKAVQQSVSSQQQQDGQQMQGGTNGDAARQDQQEANRSRQQFNDQNAIPTVDDLAAANTDRGNGNRGTGQLYL